MIRMTPFGRDGCLKARMIRFANGMINGMDGWLPKGRDEFPSEWMIPFGDWMTNKSGGMIRFAKDGWMIRMKKFGT